jgi:predicted secreted hydrolase
VVSKPQRIQATTAAWNRRVRVAIGRVPRWVTPRFVAASVVLLAAAGGVVGVHLGIASAGVLPTVRPVVLPADHGAHPGFEVEWWYTAGTLTDSKGREYFWFATAWSGGPGQVARVNVVDLRADRIVLAHEYVTNVRSAVGQARLNVGVFRFGWQRTGVLGRWSVDAPNGSGLLRLSLRPGRPYVLNGRDGIIQQGPGGPSAYYSEPRLAASGILELKGQPIRVTGEGWLDHQWGNFAGNVGSLRWNWFGCQFRDGRNLMLYQFLNRHDGPSRYQAGTLVTGDNGVKHLVHFKVLALRPFFRPTGALATYPLRWRLEVPSFGIDITLRALARQQFVSNSYVPSFWEGAATVTRGSPGSCIVESSREVPPGST